MSFRENLLKKIEIDQLAQKARRTIAPAASDQRLDKEAVRRLLALSSFTHTSEREMDLYVKERNGGDPLVLVLDNELPIYRTSIADVAMRKSPYIKEMLSFRGIIKILKDSDVKISRKEASLDAIRADCLELLDLSYTDADIETIAYDGAASLESRYPEGVIENLKLFAELCGFQPAPAPFKSDHHIIFGKMARSDSGAGIFGPLFIYDRIHDRLGLVEEPVAADDPGQIEQYRLILEGKDTPPVQGTDVFKHLKALVPPS